MGPLTVTLSVSLSVRTPGTRRLGLVLGLLIGQVALNPAVMP